MRPALLALPLALLALPACSSSDDGTGTPVAVRATDSTCEVGTTTLPVGKASFTITNGGTKTTEVYVYQGKKVVAEKEDIGPGTTAKMGVDLKAGSYEVACKPGQKGDGIRTPVTVG